MERNVLMASAPTQEQIDSFKGVRNVTERFTAIQQSGNYDIVIVGHTQFDGANNQKVDLLHVEAFPEGSNNSIKASVAFDAFGNAHGLKNEDDFVNALMERKVFATKVTVTPPTALQEATAAARGETARTFRSYRAI